MNSLDFTSYFTDAYDFDPETWAIGNWRVWLQLDIAEGKPDGLLIDPHGYVLSVLFDGAAVLRLAPDGVSIVPQSMTGFRIDRIVYRPIAGDDAAFDLSFCFREPVSNPALNQFLKTTARPRPRSRAVAGRTGGG